MLDIRVNSLDIFLASHAFPRSYVGLKAYWLGYRSQSFPLLSASRRHCHGLAAFSP